MMKSELLSIQTLIQNYFYKSFDATKKVSYHTVCSYKDAFRLYLRYLEDVHGISATKVSKSILISSICNAFVNILRKREKINQ